MEIIKASVARAWGKGVMSRRSPGISRAVKMLYDTIINRIGRV